ncbi:hypothetical protein LZ554_009556 [Drepanopeziza brunnea f. sp. 'monogermtubi']|nr:hypothetical protein LZ554_009556 [Drepanopeziza brunnea f. sp. 'monogermtubi']
MDRAASSARLTGSPEMEICEQNEVWAFDDDQDMTFSHTKLILKSNDGHFYTTSPNRQRPSADIDITQLNCVPIPASDICPLFPAHFTKVFGPISKAYYIKRSRLIHYVEASTEIATLVLHEARICEHLRLSPHPNIAKYRGCLVQDGRITGLCFVRYGQTLHERVTTGTQPYHTDQLMKAIEAGVQHLHHMGLVHCDLNPHNIFMDGDTPVIGDFDSCQLEGEKLGLKAGTYGWTNEAFQFALYENDDFGLSKIRDFLLREQNMKKSD